MAIVSMILKNHEYMYNNFPSIPIVVICCNSNVEGYTSDIASCEKPLKKIVKWTTCSLHSVPSSSSTTTGRNL
jgi:hypothetical protein